jgi:hypothetical protein
MNVKGTARVGDSGGLGVDGGPRVREPSWGDALLGYTSRKGVRGDHSVPNGDLARSMCDSRATLQLEGQIGQQIRLEECTSESKLPFQAGRLCGDPFSPFPTLQLTLFNTLTLWRSFRVRGKPTC